MKSGPVRMLRKMSKFAKFVVLAVQRFDYLHQWQYTHRLNFNKNDNQNQSSITKNGQFLAKEQQVLKRILKSVNR